jgi:hypothetical protein
MNNETTTTPPRLTGISFHDVETSHISTDVRDFGNFAIVTINIGKADISFFTTNIQEAHSIMTALSRYTTHQCQDQ